MKRAERTEGRGAAGYLTVYAALSLAVLVSLFLALLEGVRQNTVYLEAEIIADTAIDSVLAEYHRELLEQYNLFFLDTSYGTAEPSVRRTEQRLFHYAEANCAMEEVSPGELRYRDFLKLETGAVSVSKAAFSTDGGGYVFRERAIEAVKEDIGLGYVETVKDWLNTVEQNGLDVRNVDQEKQTVDANIRSFDGKEVQIDGEWVEAEVEDLTEPLEVQRQKGILQLVVEDVNALSAAGVATDNLISARFERGEVEPGNWDIGEPDGSLQSKLLFQEYIMRYCGCYTKALEKGLLRYQAEYVIAGKDSDIENLKAVANRLCAIREAANAIYIFTDEAKCSEAEAVATLAASAMLVPEIAPLLQATILFGWAYAESLYDVRCLLAGKKVPLLKTADTWHCDIGCVLEGALDTDVPEQEEEGLDYEGYLRILLGLQPLEEQTFRMMDLVEMDVRQTPGNRYFRIDGCIDRLEAQVQIVSAYGYEVTVIRGKGY